MTLNSAIARIRTADGRVVGAGFLVGQRQVLTCAHVVALALGVADDMPEAPQTEVHLDFPLVAPRQVLTARVVYWLPSQSDGGGDIAGLELVDEPPDGTSPIRLVRADLVWDHPFRAFGFPKGYDNGVWASGRILDREATGWLQIEDIKRTGYFVQQGFSGTAVWDETLGGVVGMTVAAEGQDKVRAAFILPTENLVMSWKELATWTALPCPYRGLLAFREQDAPFFFGRETFTSRLVEAVEHGAAFIAVLGPSGSGKSSIVFAGLVPHLRRADDNWLIAQFRPGASPFRELANALLPLLEPGMTRTERLIEVPKLAGALEHGEVHLLAVVNSILEAHEGTEQLLLVIDQFEELYTSQSKPESLHRFLDLILTAVTNKTDRRRPYLTILLTLRADFLGQTLDYRPFADAMDKAHKVIVGLMTREEMERAIECPAQQQGLVFEEGLVARILNNVGDEPGGLPLLEFALTQLWEQQENGQVKHRSYDIIGKVDGALAHHAEKVYESLTDARQHIMQRILLRLTQPGEGTEDTRRQARLAELLPADGEPTEVEAVVRIMTDARLLTADQDPQRAEVVDVAHEALIKGWPRLKAWIDQDRKNLLIQRRLAVAANQWEEKKHSVSCLYRGMLLAEAVDWADTHPDNLNPIEEAFLRTSQDAERRERREKRLRQVGVAVVTLLAVAIVAAMGALGLTGQLNQWVFRPLPIEWVAVPAGEFLMGSSDFEIAQANAMCLSCPTSDEQPVHRVFLDGFEIGRYEVTNKQYFQCVRARVCSAPENDEYALPELEEYPIRQVSWEDARTFCEWSGGRLPSEAEWEKAARGTTNAEDALYMYSWGGEPDPSKANVGQGNSGTTRPVIDYADGASPYHALNMTGNVWEWVNDWYDREYYKHSPFRNPSGALESEYRVIRGGSYFDDWIEARTGNRAYYSPQDVSEDIGFRCARDILPGQTRSQAGEGD